MCIGAHTCVFGVWLCGFIHVLFALPCFSSSAFIVQKTVQGAESKEGEGDSQLGHEAGVSPFKKVGADFSFPRSVPSLKNKLIWKRNTKVCFLMRILVVLYWRNLPKQGTSMSLNLKSASAIEVAVGSLIYKGAQIYPSSWNSTSMSFMWNGTWM